MPLFNRTYTLFHMSAPVGTDQTGKTFLLMNPRDGEVSLRVFVDLTQSGGGDSPSVTVHLETSHDKTSWVPAVLPIASIQEGTIHKFEEVAALGRYVRVRTVLGGGTKPTHKVSVVLASDTDLTVKAQ